MIAKPSDATRARAPAPAPSARAAARQRANPAGSAVIRTGGAKAANTIRSAAPSDTDTGAKPDAREAASARAKVVKPPKLKQAKPVRDSFTMPKAEYQLIELLKQRASANGRKVKKSELLRAGILALAGMNDARLFDAIAAVPAAVGKPGRAKGHGAAAAREPGLRTPAGSESAKA